jgi:hypothetical protein
LFNHTTNAFAVNHFNNSLNEFLFGFFWTKLLYGKSALEVAERESSTAGTVASIHGIVDSSFFKTTDKGFGVTH